MIDRLRSEGGGGADRIRNIKIDFFFYLKRSVLFKHGLLRQCTVLQFLTKTKMARNYPSTPFGKSKMLEEGPTNIEIKYYE